MKTINFLIILSFLSFHSFSQKKAILVNKLVDVEIGMTYEQVIEHYPNPTQEEKKENKIDMYYSSIELSNGLTVTKLLLSFYKNKLYDISADFNNTLHLGLVNKYGYKSVKGMTYNGYYGTSHKTTITADYRENRIWIVDNNIRKLASTEGF